MALTTQTALFLNRLAEELGYRGTPTIQCDNQAVLSVLVSQNMYHKRAKHISIREYFVRELVQEKQIEVCYIGSDLNCADLMTKPAVKPIFTKLRSMIGVAEISPLKQNGFQIQPCEASPESPLSLIHI